MSRSSSCASWLHGVVLSSTYLPHAEFSFSKIADMISSTIFTFLMSADCCCTHNAHPTPLQSTDQMVHITLDEFPLWIKGLEYYKQIFCGALPFLGFRIFLNGKFKGKLCECPHSKLQLHVCLYFLHFDVCPFFLNPSCLSTLFSQRRETKLFLRNNLSRTKDWKKRKW